jgi:pimeloyl-ACP methyl ester carboxylesterase
MNPRITRHFITVGKRRVHYTRAGEGPAVALLHASACSAKVLREAQTIFATRFTAFAFDTPGFGLSDLLPKEQPETEDLADGLAEVLTELGIEQIATYGRHTGAQVAVEFAVRHRARCSLALTDGYPIFLPSQQWARLNEYLVPIVPSFAGEHLLWLWFRYRDQHVFWPWNEQRLEKRADSDLPSLDFLHRGVIEFLEAGNDYKIGYATAFRHDGLKALANVKVPVCLGVRPGDSLFRTKASYPAGSWIEEMPRDSLAAARAELAVLLKHSPKGMPPPAPQCQPITGRTTTSYVDLGNAQILVRSVGDLQSKSPIVVIHHAPGSSFLYDELVREIGKRQPVLALDLPGHGESDAIPGAAHDVATWADTVLRTLDVLGIGAFRLYGHNGGAAVAVETALRARDRVQSLILDAPICFTSGERAVIAARWLDGVAPVTPVWDGSHLTRVWHMRRDMELWWPWFDRRNDTRKLTDPRIDPARLTIEVREMMKQPASFVPAWRAVLDYPLAERLALTHQRCGILVAAQDIFAPCAAYARAMRPDARFMEISDSVTACAEAVIAGSTWSPSNL